MLPEPRFTKDGQYRLTTKDDRYAAAVSTIRCALNCIQAYHDQGPDVVIENMRVTLDQTLTALFEHARAEHIHEHVVGQLASLDRED